MGIQINGQTDIISSIDGGNVTIPTATFPSVTDLNATGIVTASSFVPTGSSVPANGMYLPTTNTLAWSTGSIERIRINSNGNLGIGTNNPESLFHVNGDATAIRVTRGNSIGFVYNTGTSLTSTFRVQSNDGPTELYTRVAQPILFTTNDAEKSRIDSSGRLLIGTSSAPTSGDPQYAKLVVSGNTASSTGDSFINITRNLAASSISSGSPIGAIFFTESSGGVYAQIQGVCDATGGTNDYPGRLSFYTTADGASSQTERLRIDNAGRLGINNTSQSTNPDRTIIFGSSTDKYALHLSMANNAASGAVNTAALRIDGTQGRGTGVYYGIQVDVSEIDVGTCYGTYSKATGTYGQQYAVYGEISKNLAAYTSAYGVYSKLVTSNSGGGAYFYWGEDNGTTRFYVGQNGGIANYQANNTNLSDEREKKDIINLDSTWECLKHWEIKKFRYNEDNDTTPERYGVIAQQVQQHCPEVIDEWVKQAEEPAKFDDNGNEIEPAKEKITRMGVKEQQMYWMAIKALQEAQERIETLETEVVELKSKVI